MLELKEREARRIDVSEWNDSVEAYAKPLSCVEKLVFNDLVLERYDRTKTERARYDAAFSAAATILVDASGAPILTEDDRERIANASFAPIQRALDYGTNERLVDERFKKN